MEVFHDGRALVGVNEGLDSSVAERFDEGLNILLPKEIVHLQLVLLAADAAGPGAVGFAGSLLNGELGGLILGVPGFQLIAVPAEGVDDLLLASLTLDAGGLVLVADALEVFKVGVVGVHHGRVPPLCVFPFGVLY